MQQSTEHDILNYFSTQGEQFEDEKQVIGAIIQHQMAAHGHVTNKAIILRLISMLETTEEAVQQDVLRNALEIVLGRTEDDIGF